MKVKLLVQIGIVFTICLVGEGIARLLPFAFPASVISMILLFLLLLSGALKVEHIREKGDFLLRNMAFFFIPSGVGLIEQTDVLRGKVLPLLAVCLITTVLTFAVSAATIRLVSSWQNRLKKGGR
jgi:holin-like protein